MAVNKLAPPFAILLLLAVVATAQGQGYERQLRRSPPGWTGNWKVSNFHLGNQAYHDLAALWPDLV